jgi:hypothetical protein
VSRKDRFLGTFVLIIRECEPSAISYQLTAWCLNGSRSSSIVPARPRPNDLGLNLISLLNQAVHRPGSCSRLLPG